MKLANQIESLLFISHKPLSQKELIKTTGCTNLELDKSLEILVQKYNQADSGVRLIFIDDKYQLVTDKESSQIVKNFVNSELTGELTRPALETLTVIAYRGPVSKSELEAIRGVNCSLILRNLLIRGLIDVNEDKDKGLAFYQISFDFLKYLGLNSVEDLPEYQRLNQNNNLDKLLNSDQS